MTEKVCCWMFFTYKKTKLENLIEKRSRFTKMFQIYQQFLTEVELLPHHTPIISAAACDIKIHMTTYPHRCKIPSMSKRWRVPASMPNTESHLPDTNIFVKTATLVAVTIGFHDFVLS